MLSEDDELPLVIAEVSSLPWSSWLRIDDVVPVWDFEESTEEEEA